MSGPLTGLRVFDLTRILAGPMCTQILGDLGADVVKVEQPGRGDDSRGWIPPAWGDEAASYLSSNRNKRGIAVDLIEESRSLVDLACDFDEQADIELFHAFTPMHEGKLRYADVSAHAIDAYRHACARQARERMLWLSDASNARRNRVVSSTR